MSESKVLNSISEYVPTSFKSGVWEVLSGSAQPTNFLSIDYPIIEVEREEDTFFQSFDNSRVRPSEQKKEAISEEEIQRQVEAKLSEEREAHYQKGLEEGKELAKVELTKEFEDEKKQLRERIEAFEKELTGQINATIQQIEVKGVELALDVAKKIVSAAADANPSYIAEIISYGLESLQGNKVMEIRISPQDFEFLKVEDIPHEFEGEELQLRYKADESITHGCVIVTELGEIDLQVDQMWERVSDKILEVVK